MSDWLSRAALEHPSAVALDDGDRRLDYRSLAQHAAARAASLQAMGLGFGDRVVLPVRTTIETAIWIHALLWLGAPVIPVSPALHPNDLEAIWRDLRPRGLIADNADWPAASDRSDRSPDDRIVVDARPQTNAETYSQQPPSDNPSRIATVLLTSGSSAAPKAVPLSVRHHEASARAVGQRLGLGAADRWLLALPLNHIGGLAILLRGVIFGSQVVFQRRFEARAFAEGIARHRITLTSMVPSMLDDLMRTDVSRRTTPLRAVLVGGARTDPALLALARRRRWPVIPTWGMTEAASQLATPGSAEAAAMEHNADQAPLLPPLNGVEVRSAPNGRLLVRGPMVFDGYIGEDAPGPDADGWFTTGDRGRIGPDGSVQILGRADDVIISGGLNVHLDSVAQQLAECPLIAQAATVAVDDDRWGQRVAAAVVAAGPVERAEGLVESLDCWARQQLAPEERPVRWRIVDRIPRSTTGKPIRPAVATLFE